MEERVNNMIESLPIPNEDKYHLQFEIKRAFRELDKEMEEMMLGENIIILEKYGYKFEVIKVGGGWVLESIPT